MRRIEKKTLLLNKMAKAVKQHCQSQSQKYSFCIKRQYAALKLAFKDSEKSGK